MNKRTVISSIGNLLLIVLFAVAYVFKPMHSLQTVWIVLTLTIPILIIILMIKELKGNPKHKILSIVNLALSAIFFLTSAGLLIYTFIK